MPHMTFTLISSIKQFCDLVQIWEVLRTYKSYFVSMKVQKGAEGKVHMRLSTRRISLAWKITDTAWCAFWQPFALIFGSITVDGLLLVSSAKMFGHSDCWFRMNDKRQKSHLIPNRMAQFCCLLNGLGEERLFCNHWFLDALASLDFTLVSESVGRWFIVSNLK